MLTDNIKVIIQDICKELHLDISKTTTFVKQELTLDGVVNVKNYIKKSCLTHKTELEKDKVCIDIIPVHRKLKELNFEGSSEEHFYLELVLEHIVNEYPVSVEQVRETVHKVIEHCEKNNIKTYSDVIDFIANKSRIAKLGNYPEKYLREQAKQLADDWERIIKELEIKEEDEETGEY